LKSCKLGAGKLKKAVKKRRKILKLQIYFIYRWKRGEVLNEN